MKKIVFCAVALGISSAVFAQIFINRTEAEAKKAWPQLEDCPTCRHVLIDMEPYYKRLCGRQISEAEAPFLLAQVPIKRMVAIRDKENLLKMKDAALNLHEADLVTYRINGKRMKCVSEEEVAGITSEKPPKPVE